MSSQGLRIVPVYAEPDAKRSWRDVWSETEKMGEEAFEQDKRITGFLLCSEDWALIVGHFGPPLPGDPPGFQIGLLGHDECASIREGT